MVRHCFTLTLKLSRQLNAEARRRKLSRSELVRNIAEVALNRKKRP